MIKDRVLECSPFPQNEEPILFALHGTPGIGKSSIALKVAKKIARVTRPDVSWWLHANGDADLHRPLRELSGRLGLATEGWIDQDVLTEQIVTKLSAIRIWLLVPYDALSKKDIDKLRPSGAGVLIVTSRNSEWGSATRSVELLEEKDAIDLLQGYCEESRDILARLARTVGYLPLGLIQVGVYIQSTERPVDEVITMLMTEPLKILDDREMFWGYASPGVDTIARTMTLILGELATTAPCASFVFCILAHLGERIPWDLLSGPVLKHLLADGELSAALDEAGVTKRTILVPLTRRALIARDRDHLIMHALVTRVSVALLAEQCRNGRPASRRSLPGWYRRYRKLPLGQ
jgi:hypothetical protein